ncbi:hypothetical protein ABZ897_20255 [Nonomuraea sp. NPDC046802]|uniref:hypothetical protein n=1 Tax=Nonomuraea sp. NPDC046802 TaxID=3154919 RepID=UPI0033E05670
MPSHIPREHARHLHGAIPTLVLYSAEPIVQLPLFRLFGSRPATCVGWEFVSGLTASMINGPGRFELLVEGVSHPDELDEALAWNASVERAGGAAVLVVDARCMTFDWAVAADGGRARGGFVRTSKRAGKAPVNVSLTANCMH